MRTPLAPGPEAGRRLGLALGVGGILLLSTESLIVRGADASAWDVGFWSGSWAAVAVLAALALSPGPGPIETLTRDRRALVISTLLQTTSAIAFIVAVKETAVANVVVITASAPVFAALIAWTALGERPTRRVWWAIGATMLGIVMVVGGSINAGGIGGELAALTAVLAFGANVAIWRHHPGLSRIALAGLSGLTTALVCAAPAEIVGLDRKTMLLLVLMGAVVWPISRVSLSSATRYLTAVEVGLFPPIETVAAAVGAWLIFDESPAALTWLGGAVVLSAVTVGLTGGSASKR